MSITSVNNNTNPLYPLQPFQQGQTQAASTASGVGAAAALDLSNSSNSNVTKAGSDSQAGGLSTNQCPLGYPVCTNCGQCGKITAISGAVAQSNATNPISANNNTNYQTLQAANAYEKTSIYI
ncbi:Hypothetical protein LUCI_2450 [Lucifera butyrica]|uniref:Uncharacterized protein n=1 Tax=Lucifera butyrica TaxID=1351585 RepID=A0A498R3H2_9FIRM|nr:hypothetical protein [Lucifera butyrica]VBB07206.1 Hypothetical protein LUCI_2450 [Lucifera butyrica]